MTITLDCSGFATNYLIAVGKRSYSSTLFGNHSGASSYYQVSNAVNDPLDIRRGDLLVWIKPEYLGHVAVVESFLPVSRTQGNLRVVEATACGNAHPKLLDSWYTVEQIIEKGDTHFKNEVMNLKLLRFNDPNNQVAVMRPV